MNKNTVLLVLIFSMPIHAAKQSVSGSNSFTDMTFDILKMSGSSSLNQVRAQELCISGSLDFAELTIDGTFKASGHKKGSNLVAGDCDFSGHTSLTQAKMKSLSSSGSTKLQEVEVESDLVVSGSTKANQLSVGGAMEAFGSLSLVNSQVHDLVCSSEAVLTDTQVNGNITIEQSSRSGVQSDIPFISWILSWFSSSNDSKRPVLYLQGKTVVNGDITFFVEGGIVYTQASVTINGKINGGTIITQS